MTKKKLQSDFSSIAEYLLKLQTNTPQPTAPTPLTEKDIYNWIHRLHKISMANQIFHLAAKRKPFNYLLTYKYSQDHLELLFSCIRSRGGWNNNRNCLQLKYAPRKMLM